MSDYKLIEGLERQLMRLRKIRDVTIIEGVVAANAREAKSDQDLDGSPFLFEQIDRLHRATKGDF